MKREDEKFQPGVCGGRNEREDVLRSLRPAMRSSSELEYRLLLAYDLGLLDYQEYKKMEDLILRPGAL
ncbi:MAG TPA: four helix bundle protein [Terriglobia bacterium]|nr:four helix bundle protein [Terriglobia bacterium]